ncbi:MAG: glycosyltransferase family 2 protein [Polyangiaceae bacterium]
MTPTPSLSVFFPAYNDRDSIGALVEAADRTARELTPDYEIIVVDDGSSDGTAQVLEELTRRYDRLRVLTHPQNRGYGGALRSGFGACQNELVFYTDGDGQYDPSELRRLWGALTEGVDVVQGYKARRSDPLSRVVTGALYEAVVRRVFRLVVRDVDCDFRLIRRSVLDRVGLASDSGAICVEFVRKAQDAGARFVEVPVRHYPRQHGRSQAFRPRQILHMLRDLAALRRELA